MAKDIFMLVLVVLAAPIWVPVWYVTFGIRLGLTAAVRAHRSI